MIKLRKRFSAKWLRTSHSSLTGSANRSLKYLLPPTESGNRLNLSMGSHTESPGQTGKASSLEDSRAWSKSRQKMTSRSLEERKRLRHEQF